MRLKLFLSVLFTCTCCWILAQATDSTSSIPEPDDEFNLFLLMFALAAISLAAGMFVIAVIVSLLCLAILSGLMLTGVLSASFLIGYQKKSFKKGVMSFVMIGASLFCGITGMLLFSLIAHLFKIDISNVTALVTGFAAGAIGGALSAKLILKIAGVFFQSLTKHIG